MFPERTDQALISLENRPAPLESHDRGRTSIGKVDIFRPEADIFVPKLLIPGKTLLYASVTLRTIAPLAPGCDLPGGYREGGCSPRFWSDPLLTRVSKKGDVEVNEAGRDILKQHREPLYPVERPCEHEPGE